MGRNPQLLEEILNVLAKGLFNKEAALHSLERHFQDRLILDVGNIHTIEAHARQLRLRVEKEELPLVLDEIASKGMMTIGVDVVEQAINEMWEDRFIEPGG